MTVRTQTFESQLDYFASHGYDVIPLDQVIAWQTGKGPAPARPSVAITVDDGHASVFAEMRPIVLRRRLPVTLFIYPSAISNASYAMTWTQIAELQGTGLFDVQSHTFWHPNFKIERRRLAPPAYDAFVRMQLVRPREILRDRLGVDARVLAWPFGIVDEDLMVSARDAGYVAGFTLERRVIRAAEDPLALPRFLMTDGATGASLSAMLPKETR